MLYTNTVERVRTRTRTRSEEENWGRLSLHALLHNTRYDPAMMDFFSLATCSTVYEFGYYECYVLCTVQYRVGKTTLEMFFGSNSSSLFPSNVSPLA